MLLSLNWLNDFVDLKGLSTDEIKDKLVKAGFEVEGEEHLGLGTNLVVGKVISCKDHPNSDHLHITKVDIGSEVLDIVCGAPNCREGLKVIVAKVGAKLPGGEIKAGVIRGETSNGMLCSLKELNITEDMLPENSPSINGIEELDDSFNVGDEDILNKLGYEDTIFDVSIYANRPDCAAMHYMAKEAAAILDRPCKLPDFDGASSVGNKTNFKLNSTSKNCTHFLAKVINNVTIKESPEWLKRHLRSNGIKTINNLVDISNYVMLETGQPLHFYDLSSNPNKNITVVDDYVGKYTALDGIEYNIEKGDLVITSDNKPIGIAGIMGGDNTKILDTTKGLIIEAALFDSAQIRRTSNRLGLQTEAAARFSKGLEPLAQNKAMDRAVQLLIDFADAKDIEETVEFGKANYEPYTIVETVDHLNSLIGKKYSVDEAVSVMKRLSFEVKNDDKSFTVTIPSYRSVDLKIPVDLDEEIVRLTDFDDLKSTLPLMPQTVGSLSRIQNIRRSVRDTLVYQGLNETVSYTLVSEDMNINSILKAGEGIEVLAPLSDDRKFIRSSLMNSLLQTLCFNVDHGTNDINLFEVSTVYGKDVTSERLGIILYNKLSESKVLHNSIDASFYSLKGLILLTLNNLGFDKNRVVISANTLDVDHFHPYQSATIKINDKLVGIFGKLHPSYLNKYKVKDVYYCELILDVISDLTPSKTKAPIINKYPSISRDISVIVKSDVDVKDIMSAIKKAAGNIVKSVDIFDVYNGEHIEQGFKSLSFNIVYEDANKTLKVEDIEKPHKNVLDTLVELFNAKQR